MLRSSSPQMPPDSWGVATAGEAQLRKWIIDTLHSLFHTISLLIKRRLGFCQPLYFCLNALWKGFWHAKELHSKIQVSVFLQRLSLESSVHQYPWPHPHRLVKGTEPPRKGWAKKTNWCHCFWLKMRNLGSYCCRQVARESFSALLQEALSERTSM